MCVHIYQPIYLCADLYMCIYISMYLPTYLHTYLYTSVYIPTLPSYMRIYLYIYVPMYLFAYVYMCDICTMYDLATYYLPTYLLRFILIKTYSLLLHGENSPYVLNVLHYRISIVLLCGF